MQVSQLITLIVTGSTMFGVIGFLFLMAHYYTLNGLWLKGYRDKGRKDSGRSYGGDNCQIFI